MPLFFHSLLHLHLNSITISETPNRPVFSSLAILSAAETTLSMAASPLAPGRMDIEPLCLAFWVTWLILPARSSICLVPYSRLVERGEEDNVWTQYLFHRASSKVLSSDDLNGFGKRNSGHAFASRIGTSRDVAFGVSSESANFDLAGADCTVWVDDNGDERVGKGLLGELSRNIDTTEPAAITRMTVVPADGVFELAGLTRTFEVFDHILVGLVLSVDSCLSSFDRQAEGVGDNKGLVQDVADHKAHDFNAATGAGVHDHLGQSDRGDLDMLEVVGVGAPWLLVVDVLLLFDRVGIWLVTSGVCKVDCVVQLWKLLSAFIWTSESDCTPTPRLPWILHCGVCVVGKAMTEEGEVAGCD
ncbi:Mov34-domain-containing protein, partial [Aureobasidium melanogenum]